MKTKFILFFLSPLFGVAQNIPINYNTSLIDYSEIQSPILETKQVDAILRPHQANMAFSPLLVHSISTNPPETIEQKLEAQKASKDYLKHFPYNKQRVGNDVESVLPQQIKIGNSFYGDIDGQCPNDNTIAISKGGKIMSMMNEYVGLYTTNGTKLNIYTLNDFFDGLLNEGLCDPKVIYDPVMDRFFMFIQACNDDPQHIAFGFSKSNDPNGNWAIYIFDSDGLGDGSWSDYPKVAINKDEVFVSMNLFGRGSSGSYNQSIVYQLDKKTGFQGQTMNFKIWKGFQDGTILPIRSGPKAQYGPGLYLVQGTAGGADFFNFYQITGNLNDPNSKLIYKKIQTTAYEPSGNAYQLGTSVRLDIGDCRFQDGYYQDGIIHFVFAADDQGYSGIRYHRLNPAAPDGNTFEIFSASDDRDYVYPSIESFSNTDNSAIIHFASSGENFYPDMRAKLFYNDMSSAGSIRVKVGPGPNTACENSKGISRWGDYTGLCRNYALSNPTVWIAGSVGNDINGKWWTYIAELYSAPDGLKINDLGQNVSLSPNPVSERIKIQVEVKNLHHVNFLLQNEKGQLLSNLYSGILTEGINNFSFDASTLSSGTYFITVQNQNHEIIKSEKFVVLH